MIHRLQITVIVENTAGHPELLAEHGLACWVEADGHRLLFDTGQGRVLADNAERLGIDLSVADSIVLSHGHYDHTGGLAGLLATRPAADLYVHPAAFFPKYAREKAPPHRNIGLPRLDEQTVRGQVRKLTFTEQPTVISPAGIFLTGEVPRHTDFEDVGGPFFADQSCETPDPLPDDQALYVDTPEGLVVLLGCAHSGVVNTLDHISDVTGGRRIHAVLGGLHLVRASHERLQATVHALTRYGVDVVAPGHCTGTRATTVLWQRMPDQCRVFSAGSRFIFGAKQ